MRTVWKYQISSSNPMIRVPMRSGSKVLHVGEQNGLICIWFTADTTKIEVVRSFQIVGTGNEIKPGYDEHIGSVQIGLFVFHVFEAVS